MPLYASVYMCLLVTCWERADLMALVCGVLLWVCHFPIGILGQVWYLIVSIPDLCTLSYFKCILLAQNPNKVWECVKIQRLTSGSAVRLASDLSGQGHFKKSNVVFNDCTWSYDKLYQNNLSSKIILMWYLIVSIPELCPLSYFKSDHRNIILLSMPRGIYLI